jgi:hypothetical protein
MKMETLDAKAATTDGMHRTGHHFVSGFCIYANNISFDFSDEPLLLGVSGSGEQIPFLVNRRND